MADIVTFDPVNKIITPIDSLGTGNIEINVAEIYSEWKTWMVVSSSAGYAPAMRTVGGDPVTDIQNLGATFFLINDWRIRPNERDHRLTLVGNLFTDPAGENVSVPTVGPHNVTVEMFVSNLVDSSVARLDLTQLLAGVYVTETGVSGSAEGVGTPTNPVNNLEDAFIIANRDNLQKIIFQGAFNLSQDASEFTFSGEGSKRNNELFISNSNLENVLFFNCTLSGTLSGSIQAEDCRIHLTNGVNGTFKECGLSSSFQMADNSNVTLANCFSEVPGTATPICSMGSNSFLNVRNWSGGFQLNSSSAGCISSIDGDPGSIILDSSNVGGQVTVRGFSEIVDNSGPSCTVVKSGFFNVPDFYDVSSSVELTKQNSALAVALIASK